MGGGYFDHGLGVASVTGLSPHGRGILPSSAPKPCRHGPIPAWAGDTRSSSPRLGRRWAYPRMGGGYRSESNAGGASPGLSPHGRGILPPSPARPWRLGPIPAWAGDTSTSPSMRRPVRAYPRMGGGYRGVIDGLENRQGLSPHGRGILAKPDHCLALMGPIPAWAGDTRVPTSPPGSTRAYPRMGGGYCTVSLISRWCQGLSPHGRGIQPAHQLFPVILGPIPAWAGDTSSTPPQPPDRRAYPRMGGGYRAEVDFTSAGEGLSPHGRGIRGEVRRRCAGAGPIPAWAGDTARRSLTTIWTRAYPRMGGGYASRAAW